MNDKRRRVAVIGAGIAGLTAAAAAARAGAAVTVFESAPEHGGRARTRSDGGYRFNLGPHALFPGTARVLRELGVDVPGRTPRLSGLAQRDGRLHRLPASAWSLVQTRLLSPLDKAELGRAMLNLRKSGPGEWHGRTVDDWISQSSQRPAVREFLHALMRLATYSDIPGRFSAGAAMAQFDEGAGVLYVDGGWATLTGQLVRMVEERGGQLRTGAPVRRVSPSPGGATVAVDGSVEAFDAVVLTGAPADVVALLGEDASGTLRRAADRAIPVHAAVLDIGVPGLPRPRRTFALGIDRPLYLSVHSAAARRLAPGGGATINVAAYVAPGERVDPEARLRELEGWAEAVQPGWRNVAAVRRFYPNLTVMNDFPQAVHGGLPGRPPIDAAGLPGVFVAGDWVGDEGILSGAAASSGAAAGKSAAVAAVALPVPVAAGVA